MIVFRRLLYVTNLLEDIIKFSAMVNKKNITLYYQ